jgi:hypothetical protein
MKGALAAILMALVIMQLVIMQLGQNESFKCQITSSNARGAFSLALKDSLGFFDDIPDAAWLERQEIARHRETTANPDDTLLGHNNANAWYQMNWEPDLNCLLRTCWATWEMGTNGRAIRVVLRGSRKNESNKASRLVSYIHYRIGGEV